jgi:hypothetical protein
MVEFTQAEKRSPRALARARDATVLIMGLVPTFTDRQITRARVVLAFVLRARAFVRKVRRGDKGKGYTREEREAALALTGLTNDTPDGVLADAVEEIT